MNQRRQKASVPKSTAAVLALSLPLGLVHAQASSASMVVPISAATATKPAPAAVVRQKITYSADLLFDFDQTALKPAGREALDELATKLTDMDLEAAVATGYTDRIGSDPYDHRLSLRRAQAVKAYLVSKNIPPEKLYTEGKGKKDPVTAHCNQQNSRQLIECLAPDRRVEVESVSTKQIPQDKLTAVSKPASAGFFMLGFCGTRSGPHVGDRGAAETNEASHRDGAYGRWHAQTIADQRTAAMALVAAVDMAWDRRSA